MPVPCQTPCEMCGDEECKLHVMTYEEFSKKQKQILDECRPLLRDLQLELFNKKMYELIKLQSEYLEQRGVKK